MPRFSPALTSAVAGQISPSLEGREDILQYREGLRKCSNFIVAPQGPVARRPGTHFVSEVADSDDTIRLIPFRVSPTLAYVVEASDLLFRYYTNEGLLDSGGPVSDTTPYIDDTLADLQYAQSAAVMFLAHPDYKTRKLQRDSATAFSLPIDATSGTIYAEGKVPMLPTNLDTTFEMTTVDLGGGDYSLTATGTGNTPFTDTATDLGRIFRVNTASETVGDTPDAGDKWWVVTDVTSTTVATVNIVFGTAAAQDATANWSKGAESDAQGFRAIAFHENRFWLLGAVEEPEGVWGSDSGDYTRFTEGGADDAAIFLRVTGSEANTIQWAVSARGALFVGSGGNEGKIEPVSDSLLTNSTARYTPLSSIGSIHAQPVVINDDVIFIQRDGRRIRRIRSTLEQDNMPEDMNVLSERILFPAASLLAYQQSPDSVLWLPRSDGVLAGITMEKQQQVAAWHAHPIGGATTAAGASRNQHANVVSAAVIPHPDAKEDQVWLCVERLIDGALVKYVEFCEDKFAPVIEGIDDPSLAETILWVEEKIAALEDDAWFLDSALERNTPLTITDISEASPGVVTSASHGLSNGAQVRITGVQGLRDDDGYSLVNFHEFLVASVTTHTFALTDLDGNNVDTSTGTDYISGGEAREALSTITGLTHLEGQTVGIMANGAEHPDEVVTDGAVTLDYPVARAIAGLRYTSVGETQRLIGGSSSSQATRIPRVGMRVDNSVAIEIATGPVQEHDWQEFDVRGGSSWQMNTPPPIFSGDYEEAIDGGWELGRTIKFRTSSVYPLTLLSLYPDAESHDR